MRYRDYVRATAREFVALMDQGRPPWRPLYGRERRRPEEAVPSNAFTGRAYRGGNAGRLWIEARRRGWPQGRWLTLRQAGRMGGRVRQGEKPVPVVFWTDRELRRRADPGTGEARWFQAPLDRPVMRVHMVFNVAQADGLEDSPRTVRWDRAPGRRERRLRELTGFRLEDSPGTPYFHPRRDRIGMPPRPSFPDEDAWLGSLTHELVHWTAPSRRCGRPTGRPGDFLYAREEMVAELGSLVICSELGVAKDLENSLSYLGSWTGKARSRFLEDPVRVLGLFNDAWRARDYVMEGREMEREPAGPLARGARLRIPFSRLGQARSQGQTEGIRLSWERTADTWRAMGVGERRITRLARWEESSEARREEAAGRRRRIYLDIPFSRKDEARDRARREGMPLCWDPEFRGWYTYQGELRGSFRAYLPREEAGTGLSNPGSLRQAVIRAGASEAPSSFQLDGRFHRLRAEGDRRGSRSLTYVGRSTGLARAVITNHRTGEVVRWKDDDRRFSTDQWRRLRVLRQNREEERRAEASREQEAAARQAARSVREARPASPAHAYLRAKDLEPGPGILQDGSGRLLVAVRDTAGRIRSLQTIDGEGRKRFLKGGSIQGHFVPFGRPARGEPLVIAEGVATALTLHRITGLASVAALHAGNLLPVARNLAQRHRDCPLVLAADNDHARPDNPGWTKAQEAARAHGGVAVRPRFGPDQARLTDFNDLARARGPEAVREVLAPALARAREGGRRRVQDRER